MQVNQECRNEMSDLPIVNLSVEEATSAAQCSKTGARRTHESSPTVAVHVDSSRSVIVVDMAVDAKPQLSGQIVQLGCIVGHRRCAVT
jgi:hypothetical protein